MHRLFVFLALLFNSSIIYAAPEISELDVGEYYTPRNNAEPLYYNLSIQNGEFKLKDKLPGGIISKIYCLSSCEYKAATKEQINIFFPKEMSIGMDIACIKNVTWAFCRANPATAPNVNMYALIALFASPTKLIPIMRVKSE
jgi:hypothetical protein